MLKAKKVLIALFLAVVMVFGVVGCNKEPAGESMGTFYTLHEAYDNGWLTQADLMSIAHYHNNGIPYYESLNEDLAKSIKKSWAQKLEDDNTNTVTEKMVAIEKYYGIYNECVIVIVDRSDVCYPAVYNPISIEIGGVTFHYGYPIPQIVVWKFEKN